MIQALLVEEDSGTIAWHRLDRYFDCLYLAGPKLWARLLPACCSSEARWNGDIGDLFRSRWEENGPCIDGWKSDFLLCNPFSTAPLGSPSFQLLVTQFLQQESLIVMELGKRYLGGES